MASHEVFTLANLARNFNSLSEPDRCSEAIDSIKTCILTELKTAITCALQDCSSNSAFIEYIEGFRQSIQEAEDFISETDMKSLSGILDCSIIGVDIARDFRQGASFEIERFVERAQRCAAFFSEIPVMGCEKRDCRKKVTSKRELPLQLMIRRIFEQSDAGKGIIARSIVEYLLGVKRKALRNGRIKVKLLIIEGLRPGLYKLEVSLLSGGSGVFFPDPEFMVFTTFGKKDFINRALKPVWTMYSGEIPQGTDVEWHISRIHSRATSARFEGTSAGAAFASALLHLIKKHPIDVTCAITGALSEKDPQKIAKVGFVSEKVKIILKSPEERGLTRTLVIPQENKSDAEHLDFDTRNVSIEYVSTLNQISHVLGRNKWTITRTYAMGILLWFLLVAGSLCFFEPVIFNIVINPVVLKQINEMTTGLSDKIVLCPVQIPYCDSNMVMKQIYLQKSEEILRKIGENLKKPRVIALDVSFESDSPEMEKLTNALTLLCENNVTVISGMEAKEKDNRNIVGDSDVLRDKLKLYCDPGKFDYYKYGLVNCGWFFSPFSIDTSKCAIIMYLPVQKGGLCTNLFSLSFLSYLAMTANSPLNINPSFSDEDLYMREREEIKLLWHVPSVCQNYMFLRYPLKSSRCKVIRFDNSLKNYTVSSMQFVLPPKGTSHNRLVEIRLLDDQYENLSSVDLTDKCIVMGREIVSFPLENKEEEILDLHLTPMGWMPGFYLHAIALSQILEQKFLRQIKVSEFLLYSLFLFCFGVSLGIGYGEVEERYLRLMDHRMRYVICWSALLLIFTIHSVLFFIIGFKFQLITMFSTGLFPSAGYIFGILKARIAWKMHREGYF